MNSTNYTTNGIHAGALWKLGDHAHLYLTSLNGNCNPLDNPQFKNAFDSAKTIAVSNFQKPIDLDDFEDREKLGCYVFPRLAEIIKKSLSLEKVEKLNNKLLQFPLFSHERVDTFESEDPYRVFLVLFLRRIIQIAISEKNIEKEMETMLILEAEKASKNIVPLFF